MSEIPPPISPSASDHSDAEERTKQVTVAGWTSGLAAFFASGALVSNPSWPVAAGVTAIAAMAGATSYFILKR